jgi:hypothetical protein
MMSSDSMIYTIGTALNRARDNQLGVQVLVEGQWLGGQVLAVDGHGVLLDSSAGSATGYGSEHAVVRMESVAAVRVSTRAPFPAPVSPPVDPAAALLPSPRGATP